MNITIITGRLTATPELKSTTSGKMVTTFTIANDTGWGENKSTNFLNCVAWNKNAENICKFFAKGDPIAIRGQIRTRNYETNDGAKRTATEILIDEFEFMTGKKTTSEADEAPAFGGTPNNGYEELEADSDLPF